MVKLHSAIKNRLRKVTSQSRPAEFLFFTELYETRWSSIRFYAEMMHEIREMVEAKGSQTRSAATWSDSGGPNSLLVIDNACIIAFARMGMLEGLLGRRYVLILGENIDPDNNTFVGWDLADYLKPLNFNKENILSRLIRGAEKVTWQNEPVHQLLLHLLPKDRISYFPISGYRASQLIPLYNGPLDVDILIYGAMAYERRIEFIRQLYVHLHDLRIAVLNNVFNLDELMSRSKVVIHINSVDGCTHIPFAKIIKPLVNTKLMFVEQAEELASSDLAGFVYLFKPGDMQGLVQRLRDVLTRFEEEQKRLESLNPRGWIERHYNFELNVGALLGL